MFQIRKNQQPKQPRVEFKIGSFDYSSLSQNATELVARIWPVPSVDAWELLRHFFRSPASCSRCKNPAKLQEKTSKVGVYQIGAATGFRVVYIGVEYVLFQSCDAVRLFECRPLLGFAFPSIRFFASLGKSFWIEGHEHHIFNASNLSFFWVHNDTLQTSLTVPRCLRWELGMSFNLYPIHWWILYYTTDD